MERSGRPALLLLAGVALLFFDLGSRVLGTNDETRFPLLARDILSRGEWLVPSLNGQPYLNKPPLYAWLIALASWPGGAVTQVSAAVVSLLAALGVIGVTYWIGRWLFDADVGFRAGLVVLTTHGVFSLARAPMPDMMLCLAVTAAMGMFVLAELGGRRWALPGFYLLVGVAFWTKGPAGLLPLPVVLAYTVLEHGLHGLRRLSSATGLTVLALALALWSVAGVAAGFEQFTQGAVRRDLIGWYFWSAAIRRSFLAPVTQPLEILLPWSLLLPLALWAVVRRRASRWPAGGCPPSATKRSPRGVENSPMPGTPSEPDDSERLRLVLVWIIVAWALIGHSAQQRMRYYLPLVPPAALLIALWWQTLPRRRAAVAFAGAWIVSALLLVGWHMRVAMRANATTDLQSIARETQGAPVALYAVDAPELVLTFYLKRPVTALPPDGSLVDFACEAHDGYLIISDRLLSDAPAKPAGVLHAVGDPLSGSGGASDNGLSRRRVAGGTISGRKVAVFSRE